MFFRVVELMVRCIEARLLPNVNVEFLELLHMDGAKLARRVTYSENMGPSILWACPSLSSSDMTNIA